MITQKAGIEAQKREMSKWEENERRQLDEARQRARERVINDFERGMGLGKSGIDGRSSIDGLSNGNGGLSVGGGEGGKGRFEMDPTSVEKISLEAEEKALRLLKEEQFEERKSKLSAFWLPTLAPEAGPLGPIKDIKLQTLCGVGGKPHPLS